MPPKHERRPDSGRGRGGRGDKKHKQHKHQDPSTRLSHSLSKVLRHKAIELGLPMTKDGYVPVALLIQHPRVPTMTLQQIEEVVRTNDKQRFKLEEKTADDFEETIELIEPFLCIRANQGHSIPGIDASALLQPFTPEELEAIPTIVHGTYEDAWNVIRDKGLSKMGRNHIHCASGLLGDDGVISGMRKSCRIYIYINPVKCAKEGVIFYRSDNGVLLTAGVNEEGILPVSYFLYVTDRNGNILLDQRSDE